MKYRPDFPDRFGCIQDSRAFCQQFFQWYNNEEHRHSDIALLTPAVPHFGETKAVLDHRQVVLDIAYQAHPDRFVAAATQNDPFALRGVDQQADAIRRQARAR